MGTPERIDWALAHLDVQPGDRLLEIGCGRGVAMSILAANLKEGHITGLDRSDSAISSASEKNRAAISAGKAALVFGTLADFPGTGRPFDRIFAINVNLFWLEAARELAVLRSLLAPKSRLFLFFEPPNADQIATIERAVAVRLAAAGYVVDKTMTGPSPKPPLLGIVARLAS